MGLELGEKGAKATFKVRCPTAWRYFDNLWHAQQATGTDRASTAIIVDANVMVRNVPSQLRRFEEYVHFFSEQLNYAVQSAAFVVVEWDESEHVTKAKKFEQDRRDALAKAKAVVTSTDLADGVPRDDQYDRAVLEAADCHSLIDNHRPARARMFDALCVDVLQYFKENYGEGSWSIAFDGVDARGVDRPPNAPRELGVLTNEPFWQSVLRRELPIGEGDLKITDVHQRVFAEAQRKDSPLHGVEQIVIQTTDTDSLIIEVLAHAKKLATVPPSLVPNQRVQLCFRETAQKRKNGNDTPLQFLSFDVAALHDSIVQTLFGTRELQPEMAARVRGGLVFLAMGLAACKCDFAEIKGFHVAHMLDCVADVIRAQPALLDALAVAWEGDGRWVAPERAQRAMLPALEALVQNYSTLLGTLPRLKRALASVQASQDTELLKVIWTAGYWAQQEQVDVESFGFATA